MVRICNRLYCRLIVARASQRPIYAPDYACFYRSLRSNLLSKIEIILYVSCTISPWLLLSDFNSKITPFRDPFRDKDMRSEIARLWSSFLAGTLLCIMEASFHSLHISRRHWRLLGWVRQCHRRGWRSPSEIQLQVEMNFESMVYIQGLCVKSELHQSNS